MKKNTLLLILCLLTISTYSQQGMLDTTFNGTGKLILQPSGSHDNANAIAIQNDSSIVFAGLSTTQNITGFDVFVGRLHSDGSTDSTFGINGSVVYDHAGYSDYAFDVDIVDENKILVCGAVSVTPAKVDMFVMRLLANGSYDTTFGGTGRVIIPIGTSEDYAYEAVMQTDGKIVLGGNSKINSDNRATLVRLNSDGSLDSSFGTNGISIPNITTQSEQINGLVLKPDSSFIAVGWVTTGTGLQARAWGILPDGSLDLNFATAGSLQVLGMAYAKSIVERNNTYFFCGYSMSAPQTGYIVSITDSGTFIPSFGNNGVVRDTFNYAVAYNDVKLQQDGKIVVAGGNSVAQFSNDLMVTRFDIYGERDTTFGQNGRVVLDLLSLNNENMLGLAIQQDGKIVACGVIMQNNNDMALIRLDAISLSTKIQETRLGNGTLSIYPNPFDQSLNIILPEDIQHGVSIVLNDITGRIVNTYFKSEKQIVLELENLSDGIYFLNVSGVNFTAQSKVIKQ